MHMSTEARGARLVVIAEQLRPVGPSPSASSQCQPTSPLSAITTTTTFKGVDPNSRNSSQVLRPPGGGSNFSLGFDEPSEQPVKKNKMASRIFGTPEENPPSWAKSAGAKSCGVREDSESPGAQRSAPSKASSGDFLDLKGEGDRHENVDTDFQASLGQIEEKPVPAAPVPSPVAPAPAPSRRNPPGGKCSLVLGWLLLLELCPSVCLFFHACELHTVSLTVHLFFGFVSLKEKHFMYCCLFCFCLVLDAVIWFGVVGRWQSQVLPCSPYTIRIVCDVAFVSPPPSVSFAKRAFLCHVG
ncbi:jupiter microtubule associated homolog 1-like [Phodopus roborovskii]|uniref:jupiter microtubule associated homolog 1-like n=1 Tax=Phodopus roborovskii TaxID=109678 RepID=UPI0021E47FFD|nr:jupiter microtubule associated homolog 1-like [Phodopus roborovskii]